jgi:CubicO group peptidase (beta-lactamase class C family)
LKPFIPFHYNVFDTENLKDGLFSRRRNATFNIKVGDGIYANSRAKFKQGFVSGSKTKKHDIEVSPGFYIFNEITDSIAVWIDSSDVDSLRNYRYSDLNFYYLKKVIERKTTNTIDVLADSLFYAPLGMNFTFFRPLQKYDAKKIVPTEDDRFFRRKLLRGYVHDQAAALSGGVAGHAGVFSNANDLAKFGQMLLNNGFYGKDNFFDWSTVDFFTQTGNQLNRRGLGFDKPEPDTTKISPACKSASLSSFGHSGFTGTYLWIDPEVELVYVFLSNRVHPDAYNRKLIDDNVRTNIQQKIYNAVKN